MTTILITDRQPLLRLGLRLLFQANLEDLQLFESEDFRLGHSQFEPDSPSIIIIGEDVENSHIELSELINIQKRLPFSRLIIYSEHKNYWQLLSYFNSGVLGFVSKQSNEQEMLKCVQMTMRGKRYISSENLDEFVGGLVNGCLRSDFDS